MRTAEKAIERQNQIKERLNIHKSVTLNELCEQFGCSEATIRNDLTKLEAAGILRRVFGGAVANENTSHNAGFAQRMALQNAEKERIAAYAVEHVLRPDMIVMLDSGTTTLKLAQKIAERKLSCTVITNSLMNANCLSKCSEVELHLIGGGFDAEHGSFHDEVSEKALSTFCSEYCFIAPNGIDFNGNVTNSGVGEDRIKQMMLQQSRHRILLADHTKLGNTEMKLLCKSEDVDMVITDDGASEKQLENLKAAGFSVEVAPMI